MRPTSGAAKAKRATVPPGPTPSWWRQQRGGSNRRPPCYSIWPSSTSTSGTTTSGKKGAKPGFPHDCWLVGAPRTKVGGFSRPTSAPLFPFWAFGTILPGCSGATTAAKLMLATLLETVATRLPTYRLWNVVDDISGHVAGTPKMVQVLTAEAAGLLVEGLQARDLPLSKGKSKVPHRWSGQAQAWPFAAVGGPRDRPVRCGTQRGEPTCIWAAGDGRSSSRAGWRGQRRERSASGSYARQGHTLASSPSLALMQGCFGVPRFWASLRHSSNPSESTRPKPHTFSAEFKTQLQRCLQMPRQRGAKTSTRLFDTIDWSFWLGRREFGRALQTSTPCRPRCAAPWPGSVVSSGRGAAPRT